MDTHSTNPSVEPPQQRQQSYWYGYVYGAFWAWVTFCCFTHLVETLSESGGQTSRTPMETGGFWTAIILWPISTAAFGWATYRLFTGKVTMRLIYILVIVHGVNIVGRGIRPGEALLYIVFSCIVVSCFKRQLVSAKRLGPTDQAS